MGCRAGLVVLVLAAGCRQLLGLNDLPPIDATSVPDVYIPDAGPCQTLGASCAGPDVRTCSVLGDEPTDMACEWGCSESGGAHCTQLVPAGGGVLPADLDPDPNLLPITISVANTQIMDTGSITNLRTAGSGTISGISFQLRNGIAIYTFDSLTISGSVLLRGNHPIALVSLGDLAIQGTGSLDAVGICIGGTPGTGGFAGGAVDASATGSGGGTGGTGSASDASGGGGGGNGADGGQGGHSLSTLVAPGGLAFGADDVPMLVGGGGGGGAVGATGGGGGGAVQLVAEHTIQILGGINVGGCGGPRGNATSAGGGGGAGGTILIEANTVTLAGTAILAANGGGGGGGGGGNVGQPGGLGTTRAAGGSCGGGNSGGLGGASGTLVGDPGANDPQTGCGGGGGTGRIRVNTASGSATHSGAVLSPGFGETASTQGIAATQ